MLQTSFKDQEQTEIAVRDKAVRGKETSRGSVLGEAYLALRNGLQPCLGPCLASQVGQLHMRRCLQETLLRQLLLLCQDDCTTQDASLARQGQSSICPQETIVLKGLKISTEDLTRHNIQSSLAFGINIDNVRKNSSNRTLVGPT